MPTPTTEAIKAIADEMEDTAENSADFIRPIPKDRLAEALRKKLSQYAAKLRALANQPAQTMSEPVACKHAQQRCQLIPGQSAQLWCLDCGQKIELPEFTFNPAALPSIHAHPPITPTTAKQPEQPASSDWVMVPRELLKKWMDNLLVVARREGQGKSEQKLWCSDYLFTKHKQMEDMLAAAPSPPAALEGNERKSSTWFPDWFASETLAFDMGSGAERFEPKAAVHRHYPGHTIAYTPNKYWAQFIADCLEFTAKAAAEGRMSADDQKSFNEKAKAYTDSLNAEYEARAALERKPSIESRIGTKPQEPT